MNRRLLAAFAPAGALTATAAVAEVTIGVSLGTTGPGSSLGIPYKNAFQLLPKTLGREPVKYIILDDESKPDNAAKNPSKFATQDQGDRHHGPSLSPIRRCRRTI